MHDGMVSALELNLVIEMLKVMVPGKTRLREPARAERLWLAMAVATLWTVTMGSDEQQNLHYTLQDQGIAQDEVKPKSELKKINRSISCF